MQAHSWGVSARVLALVLSLARMFWRIYRGSFLGFRPKFRVSRFLSTACNQHHPTRSLHGFEWDLAFAHFHPWYAPVRGLVAGAHEQSSAFA